MFKSKVKKTISLVVSLFMLLMIIPDVAICADAATSADYSISDNGIEFICAREGFSAKCYYDGAQSSIGYGTKCGTTAHSSGQHSITREAAMQAMMKEINNQYVPNVQRQTAGIQMNQNQFDALVSFTYNTGGGNTMIKNSPLVQYLLGKMTEPEARSQFSTYVVTNSATGKVDQGLINRRNAESDLFFSSPIKPDVEPTVITTNHKFYAPNSDVEIQWDNVQNAKSYWIDIYNGNDHIISEQLSKNTTQYKLDKCKKGSYGVFVATIGENNTACSDLYNFYVQDVEAPEVNTEKKHYPVGANVKITWNSPNGATSYWLDIWRGNSSIVSKQLGNEEEYLLTNCAEGNYAVFVTSMENTGGAMSTATNEAFLFSVGEIEAPNINIDRNYYSPNSNVEVTWMKVDEATCYWVDVWNGNEHIASEQLGASVCSYTINNCQEGTYAVFVTAIESAGGASSMQSAIEYFNVANVEAPYISLNKHLYFDKDDVEINWNTPNGATSYWIDIWHNNEQIVSKQLGYENTYLLKKCNSGEYSVIVTAFENTGVLSSASSEKLSFDVVLYGDCNNDREFNVSDVVLLQKWLLAVPDTNLISWQAADLCVDGKLDVFDLCMVKRKLIYG